MTTLPFALQASHDAQVEAVFRFLEPRATERMGLLVRRGTDEVIATARTRRWSLEQCNDQEKAYLGVNIENLVRAEYDLADGLAGMDFNVHRIDVDCKWSKNFGGWQIPNEAVGHICLLVYGDDIAGDLAVGLLRIRKEILVGGNRDQKKTIQRPGGMNEVRWLVAPGTAIPDNFLMSLRRLDRDAILAPRGGDERARELFKRCEGLVIHRHTIESIGQQVDEARRFRGETRAQLLADGYEVLNGHWLKDRKRAQELGRVDIANSSQWVCLRTDGSTPSRRAALEPIRQGEAATFRREFKAEIGAKRLARRKQARDAQEDALQLGLELQAAALDAVDASVAVSEAERLAEQIFRGQA